MLFGCSEWFVHKKRHGKDWCWSHAKSRERTEHKCRCPTGPTGATGATGATGPGAGPVGATGPQGPIGAQGPAGPLGPQGAQGPAGASGSSGAQGPAGPAGSNGAQGPAGPSGSNGAQGPAGPVGPQGPQGIQGPAGSGGFIDYAYIYNVGPQVIALQADIPFDTNGPLTSGISHTPSSTTVLLTNAGTYLVNWSVSGVEPNQFTVFLNGAPVAGSTYGSGAGTQQNTGQVVFIAGAGSTLTLRNHTSTAGITLQTLAGGTEVNVNASLMIARIS
jgi:hypothetical protein